MNVDTQDFNIVMEKETIEVKQTDAANIEISESPVNTVDSHNIEIPTQVEKPDTIQDATQSNIEKPTEAQAKAEVKTQTEPTNDDTQQKVEKPIEKEPEQSIVELTISKTKNKDDSKIERKIKTQSEQKEEKMDKQEVNDENKEEVVKQIVQHGVPSLVDDAGVIKDKTVWISECKSMLSVAQAIAKVDVLDMNDTTNQLENFYVIENAAKDAIFNTTTYKDPGNNGCGVNQSNGQNKGNNDNYGSGNGGGRNNGNNNGNNNGGGNNGNGVDLAEQHAININNIIEEFEIPHEDVFMKLLIQSLIEDARQCAFDTKTHYEILSHRPNTLQQALKTTITIENNRKVAAKVAKRDDPKLYNSRVPRKDDLTQIMDMLKDLKGNQSHNERPPYMNSKQISYNRLRLHDMPYNTNWKDEKPVKPDTNKETPDPLKKTTNFVDEYLWCDVCNLPHAAEQYMIAQGLIEEEDKNEDYEPTINVFSSNPYWGRNEDLSKEEEYSDVHQRREICNMHASRTHYDPEGYIHSSKKRQELGNYFHREGELEDMCKNKDVEELAEVMGTLEKKLQERNQRLERMEGEPARSDSKENEVVSKLRAPEKEKDSEAENRLIVTLNTETD
ncbi:uncharacterized protein LOC131032421 [Cryptomeria japonica]|uniref:uncharacterized protein LOC131032421 n=1 Tax=Cryptomeria japonica TaxID=3369 RepID=UPI0027D9E1B6|nr:uncharacterized protein LOC131032421 [Cryptomeria japonica]